MRKLRVGRISYANVWPIFYMLEKGADCSSYEFIEGVPSTLNRMLRDGAIDVSLSSSIEYLRNPDLYEIVENHSIDSDGPVGSVLLFSKRPIQDLGGEIIAVTSQSETSIGLLRIICSTFYGLSYRYEQTSEQFEKAISSYAAYLLIGDDALIQSARRPDLRIYDLGQLWKEHTGLPFTYALWLVRKESLKDKEVLIKTFKDDLDRAKHLALPDLRAIAEVSPFGNILSAESLVSYWKGISYDFGDAHKKGLDLFRRFAEALGLLRPKPLS